MPLDRTALTDAYRALPPGTPNREAAALLHVGLTTITDLRRSLGLTQGRYAGGCRYTPEQAREIAAAYTALPLGTSLNAAAKLLGVGHNKTLKDMLRRAGVDWMPVSRPQEARTAVSLGGPRQPLPAGHPTSWGLLAALTPSIAGEEYPT